MCHEYGTCANDLLQTSCTIQKQSLPIGSALPAGHRFFGARTLHSKEGLMEMTGFHILFDSCSMFANIEPFNVVLVRGFLGLWPNIFLVSRDRGVKTQSQTTEETIQNGCTDMSQNNMNFPGTH